MKPTTPFTRIAIFCKHPTPGKVKTRLAASVGDRIAADIYQQLLHDTVRTAEDSGIAVSLWISPADKEPWFRARYPRVEILQQPEGDLGNRLASAASTHTRRGERWLFLGSDCPTLTVRDLHEAEKALDSRSIVLGPTDDGGYWLIGGDGEYPELWRGMPWSQASLFEETIRVIREQGLRPTPMRQQSDMDTLEDLRLLRKKGKLPPQFNQWTTL